METGVRESCLTPILIPIMIPVHALTTVTVRVMRFTVHRHLLMPMDLVLMTMGILIQVCLYLTTPIHQAQARIQV
ncbi:hypothetical protein F5890DRAFT_1483833 [Lentinula detonsa]|uniref:Uncharacterized protein n=1 Tax=Lentinula detonsa TaxID=2804962 RepID=A0AA38QAM2_9AGAR|nr:hypothetical protein F5890DRAFT_1483833 [Lentinula detonsa]